MKKRIVITLLMLLVVCVIICSFALADVIYEPNDSFYEKHSEDFEYVNRYFYANGETGYLEFYSTPKGGVAGYLKNGENFCVLYTYTDKNGEVWALTEFYEEQDFIPVASSSYSGDTYYARLSDMVNVYDETSFREEHADEITPYLGDLPEYASFNGMVYWTFPRSGNSIGTYRDDFVEGDLGVSEIYTDEEGLEWGYVNYFYGYKNFWICISDLTNTQIEAADILMPKLIEAESDELPPLVSGTKLDPIKLAIILVLAVVVITSILIYFLKRNKADK